MVQAPRIIGQTSRPFGKMCTLNFHISRSFLLHSAAGEALRISKVQIRVSFLVVLAQKEINPTLMNGGLIMVVEYAEEVVELQSVVRHHLIGRT